MSDEDDVVVVGAGLGGLVLGALLAKRGRKVTVLEQHYVPGGCATTFRRKGFRFEVSLHALDGMDALDPKMLILRELDLVDKVPFVHVPRSQFYRFKHPDLDITLPATVTGAVRVLTETFPHERRNIRRFFVTISTVRANLTSLFLKDGWQRYRAAAAASVLHPKLIRYCQTSVGEILDAIFDDELLKLVLVANLLYYHDDPRKLSLFWYCLAQGGFIAGGVHFVRGGSQVLSDQLAACIRQHGGEVTTGRTVEEILVQGGRAVGVQYRKTLGRVRPTGIRRARVVVVNAAVPMAVNDLVHASEIAHYREKVNRLQKSCSFLSLFLGLNTPPSALGNRAYSTIIAGDGVRRPADLVGEFRSADWSRKGFEFIDYSQVDHGLAAPGKSVGVISLVDYMSNWDQLPEPAYRARKDEVARILICKLDGLVPGIAEAVERYEVGTPRTIVRYTKNPEGCIYGFRQDVGQSVPFRLGHRSPIPNLYFASAWVTPGGGFTGAMLAGLSCAREVDRALGCSRTRERARAAEAASSRRRAASARAGAERVGS